MNLKNKWKYLVYNYSNDKILIEKSFQAINENYSSEQRYYHNLLHIFAMLNSINTIDSLDLKHAVNDEFLFALWYHDVIYISGRKDNEIKSAEFATKWLKILSVNNSKIETVYKMIIRTQNHFENCDDSLSTKLLLDCDLHILGSERPVYIEYSKQIRQEFAFIDEVSYRNGRADMLSKFLKNSYIYKTSYYRNKYETIARDNIEFEIKNLLNQ